jgi:hypothetical protein
LLPKRFVMSWQLRLRLLRFFHWLSLSLVAQLVSVDSGQPHLCYDRQGLESRKEHRPQNTVIDMAAEMGVELLTEEQYRELQQLGEFDTKSSSWVMTPTDVRDLGGALFCDRRFGRVFVYHNGAQSYYSGRGFRCSLKI